MTHPHLATSLDGRLWLPHRAPIRLREDLGLREARALVLPGPRLRVGVEGLRMGPPGLTRALPLGEHAWVPGEVVEAGGATLRLVDDPGWDVAGVERLGRAWLTGLLAPSPAAWAAHTTRAPGPRSCVLADLPAWRALQPVHLLGLEVRLAGARDGGPGALDDVALRAESVDVMDPFRQQVLLSGAALARIVWEGGAWRVASLPEAPLRRVAEPGLPLTLRALHDAGYERIYLRGDGGRTTAHGVDGPLGADPTSPAFAARLAASYGPDPVNALTCRAGAAVPADGWLVPPLAIRRDPRAQLDARAWRWPEGWAPG